MKKTAITLASLSLLVAACGQEDKQAEQTSTESATAPPVATPQMPSGTEDENKPSLGEQAKNWTEQTKELGASAWESTKDAASKAAEGSQEYLDSAKASIGDAYEAGKDKASEAYESTRDQATEAYESAKQQGSELYESAKKKGSELLEQENEDTPPVPVKPTQI